MDGLYLAAPAKRLLGLAIQCENDTLGIPGGEIERLMGVEGLHFIRIERTLEKRLSICLDAYPSGFGCRYLKRQIAIGSASYVLCGWNGPWTGWSRVFARSRSVWIGSVGWRCRISAWSG